MFLYKQRDAGSPPPPQEPWGAGSSHSSTPASPAAAAASPAPASLASPLGSPLWALPQQRQQPGSPAASIAARLAGLGLASAEAVGSAAAAPGEVAAAPAGSSGGSEPLAPALAALEAIRQLGEGIPFTQRDKELAELLRYCLPHGASVGDFQHALVSGAAWGVGVQACAVIACAGGRSVPPLSQGLTTSWRGGGWPGDRCLQLGHLQVSVWKAGALDVWAGAAELQRARAAVFGITLRPQEGSRCVMGRGGRSMG